MEPSRPAVDAQGCAPAPGPRKDCAGALAPVQPTFRALSVTIVPEARLLDADGWRAMEQGVEEALALQPSARRRQLRLFLRAIDWMALLRWGRRFAGLDAGRQAQVLARLQKARPLRVRRGFWGLRTLVMLGYYTRPQAAAEIGYRASRRGWEARA